MKKILLLIAVIGGIAVACDKSGGNDRWADEKILDFPELVIPEGEIEPKRREDVKLSAGQKNLAAGTVDFSFRIMKEADKALAGADNIVLSPMSVSFVLSMLANGAEGDTRREMIDALGFAGYDVSVVNEYSSMLLNILPTLDNTGVLAFANSLWMNSGVDFEVYDSFEKELEDIYDSEIHAYDFAEGPGLINAWCSKKTNKLIPEVLKELNPSALMALVNALYFKGKWEDEFYEKMTKREVFTNAGGRAVDVDMMSGRRVLKYLASEKYALAELPYGNGAFSFQVLLPSEAVGVDECLESLKADEWLENQSEMKYFHIDLKLPKFKIGMNESLTNVLSAMGMDKMFNPSEADFSALSDRDSYVSDVIHATSFSVDEKGSEAAAVTVAMMVESAGPGQKEPEYIPFHVNRPFMFILKEVSTNTILFIGKVEKL